MFYTVVAEILARYPSTFNKDRFHLLGGASDWGIIRVPGILAGLKDLSQSA